jgi:undecaprenyl-phosphate 4-deoxy-4-formamido-L-arabinose transferase
VNKSIELSIVIPVYNSESTIENLINVLIEELNSISIEIILINDGSQDSSDLICTNLATLYPNKVQYHSLSRNFGEHNAVMAGLNQTKGEYVIIMDDDLQNPPSEVSRIFLKAQNENLDILYTKYSQKQHHWFRNFGSYLHNQMATLLLKKPSNLYLSSFKCLSKFCVEEIIKYTGPYPYVDGLALRTTNKIGTLEVQHYPREQGESGYTLTKLIRLWLHMFINFSVIPLRISSILGVAFSLVGALLGVIVILEKLIYHQLPTGWPSLIITVILFSGVQLLMLGMLGEYLGHLFLSANKTPQYLIRNSIKK